LLFLELAAGNVVGVRRARQFSTTIPKIQEDAMPFQATPRGIEVRVEALQNLIPVQNVYHVDNGGSVLTSDLDAVLAIFVDWMVSGVLPNLSNQYVLQRITAKDISVEDGHEVEDSFTSGNAGGNSGAAAAANAALCISWRSTLTGRSNRGRTYLGGLPNSALANAQNFDSGVASGFVDIAQDLIDALAAADKKLAVLSRVLNGVVRVVGVLIEIVSIVVDTKVDSQRRRTAN
jgi:hypothetical protein